MLLRLLPKALPATCTATSTKPQITTHDQIGPMRESTANMTPAAAISPSRVRSRN